MLLGSFGVLIATFDKPRRPLLNLSPGDRLTAWACRDGRFRNQNPAGRKPQLDPASE
jgi:hypothetical protein